MRRSLRLLVSVVLLGLGLPLLMSGCGPKIKDPHEMWDRLIWEKNITRIASVVAARFSKGDYGLTIYVVDSSGQETGYQIDSAGEINEYPHGMNEWHGRVNLSPGQIDLDGLFTRVPGEDDANQGRDSIGYATLAVAPTGKMASWRSCYNLPYAGGSLEVDGKPVNDQVDPRDPAQVAGLVEAYDDIFGAGTLIFFNAAVKETNPVRATAIPFADNPDCLLSFHSSGEYGIPPLDNMKCSAPTSTDVLNPFDLGRFSPSLVSDIPTPLESLDVDMSAIDTIIFTGTPEGNLKWNVSTIKIGEKMKYNDQMRGELTPTK